MKTSYKGSKQQAVWTHNSFIGHAVMMQQQARNIANSRTASDLARILAQQIEEKATSLEQALRAERKDT